MIEQQGTLQMSLLASVALLCCVAAFSMQSMGNMCTICMVARYAVRDTHPDTRMHTHSSTIPLRCVSVLQIQGQISPKSGQIGANRPEFKTCSGCTNRDSGSYVAYRCVNPEEKVTYRATMTV